MELGDMLAERIYFHRYIAYQHCRNPWSLTVILLNSFKIRYHEIKF